MSATSDLYLTVECPTCGAPVDVPCFDLVRAGRVNRFPHLARAGLAFPYETELSEDGRRYDVVLKSTRQIVRSFPELGVARRMTVALNREALRAEQR